MPAAAVASVLLARFDQLREAGPAPAGDVPGVLFCAVATDNRAAGTDPGSQHGFTFLILGLHDDAASARLLVDDLTSRESWLRDARETWRSVLQPFRSHGTANLLDAAQPAALFHTLTPADPAGPVAALTTVGWNREGLDMNRVREFGAGAAAVRMSMTGVPGLHTQHSFFFPGGIAIDPLTLTFWRDEASIRDFAYGQGSHRRQLDRLRADNLADRTSFSRFRMVHSAGTWHGTDPAQPAVAQLRS
jgi:hypothetical protein